MKAHSLTPGRAAFTLIELLVVVTIIAMLFALVVVGFSYAERASKRNRTSVALKSIASGLERYNQDFGEYPAPANPGDIVDIAGQSYESSGAAMLYQALSGDGYNEILTASGFTTGASPQSDGTIEETEGAFVKLTDMPKELWTILNDRYLMIDGFGRPFQYIKAINDDPTQATAETPTTVNASYDLWSYAEDEENTMATSLESTQDEVLKRASAKWIRNW